MERFSFINRLLAVCIMLLSTNSVFAAVKQQDAAKAQQLLSKSMRGFEENKGQIVDQYHQPNADVHYLFRSPGLNVQLRNNGFSYDSYRDEIQDNGKDESSLSMQRDIPHSNREVSIEHKDIKRHIHRVDIELVGANAHPIMTALSALPSMNNYYTGDKNIENVRSYERVIYTNIYPSIDLEFFISTEGKPEYQFYVRPGGDAKNIRLRYNGALKTYLSGGKIMMDVAHGSIAEHIPLSYLSQSKEEVTVRYKQIGTNEFGCEAPSYSATETLVIDPMPQLSWGTYYGGIDEYGFGATAANGLASDSQGNLYVTGWTTSIYAIATTGSYQSTLVEGQDAFLAKFDNNGALQWGTYYGGVGTEFGWSVAVDGSDNIYIAGETNSTASIATAGAHQTTLGGQTDAFLAKFNSSGTLQWGTYYGGNGNDIGRSIAIDTDNNIYMTGRTTSTSAIATTGSHQTAHGGQEDAFLVKFNGSGVRQWGTYYGGTGNDSGSGIAIDLNGLIYVTGATSSTTSIAVAGSHQLFFSFGFDAFLVKFNSSGVRQWGTYCGGSGWEWGYGVATDTQGNVYITGELFFTMDGIATVDAHQTTFGGDYDAFLVKFNSSGVRQWGTYYGGAGEDSGFDIAVDINDNVYLVGRAQSMTAIASSNAYQTSIGGSFDAFLAKFSSDGVRQWGTYYGGEQSDSGREIVADNNDNIYSAGFTYSVNGIATLGSHQEQRIGTNDAFLAKFTQIIPPSALSDIVEEEGFIYESNVPYHLYQSDALTSENSHALMGLTIRDGGAAGDEDNLPTILTSLSLSLTNGEFIRRVGLFDGTTKIAETGGGSTVTFSGLTITVNDNSSKNVTIRVSYNASVDDNAQIVGIVSAVSADSVTGSAFISDNGSVPPIEYCDSEMPYNMEGYGMYISEIQFADMTNVSDAPASTSLTYFSDKTANVTVGQTYTFTGTTNPLNQDFYLGMGVWIDFDRSNTFESHEQVFASEDIRLGTDAPFTASVTIPEDAVSGITRMRVITDYETLGAYMMPCSDMGRMGYGEVEDYNVNITGGVPPIISGPAQSSQAGDINRLEVTADRLRFVTQPSDVNVGIAMQPAVTVESVDALFNRDLDVEGREVFISNRMLNDAPVAALADEHGIATFGTLTFHTISPLEQLTASSPGYEAALSNSFAILCTGMTLNTIVHYDAATLSSADGTPLAMWSDVACYNDNAVQNNPPSRPLYRNNGMDNINNYPVVRFSFGRALSIAGRNELNGGSEKTLFAVFRTGSQVISRQVITELGGLSSGFNLYIQNSRIYGGAWDNASLWVSQPIMPNRVYLAQFVYDGTRLRLSVSEQGASTSITQSAFNDNSIAALRTGNGIGSAFQQTRYHNGPNISAGHSDFFTNHIAEIIIMNSSDVDERSYVFDSLNTKYAIGALSNPLLKEIEEELVEEYTEATPSLSVYPNPVHNSSSIYYHVPVSGDYSVVLQDVLGNTVMEIVKGTQNSGTYSTELHADALMSGMYRLVLTTSMGTISTPIVIQK